VTAPSRPRATQNHDEYLNSDTPYADGVLDLAKGGPMVAELLASVRIYPLASGGPGRCAFLDCPSRPPCSGR